MDFGQGLVTVVRWETGALVAQSAVVHPSARLGEGAVIGPATRVGENAEVGAGAVIGPACRIPDFAVIAPKGIVGARNEGYLHGFLPGGPYTIDTHYLLDGSLWFTVGCESHPLDHWDALWPVIAARNGYAHSALAVALMGAARLLARPSVSGVLREAV